MTIAISDLTNGTTGIFDELMGAIESLLDDQFAAGRITGTDYANVYLGAMQTTIEQSIMFLSTKAQDEIAEAQSTQDLAVKQAQHDLLTQQYATEVKNTLVAEKTQLKLIEDALLVEAQTAKTEAEEELLDQKKVTEYAQTGLTSLSGSATSTSLVGSQTALYTAQKYGFAQKAATDAVKLAADAWSVAISKGGNVPLTDQTLMNLIAALYTQADATPPSYPDTTITTPTS